MFQYFPSHSNPVSPAIVPVTVKVIVSPSSVSFIPSLFIRSSAGRSIVCFVSVITVVKLFKHFHFVTNPSTLLYQTKISMELQHIVYGVSPKLSPAPSIPIGKQLFSLKPPSLLSSSYPCIQSQNFEVLSEAYYPINIAKRGGCYSSRRRVWCSSSRDIADPNEGHEVRTQVTGRRKKLAVFVSGGGSNFKSIHEASKRGSLHGDVIVLVTNKSGNCPSNYPFIFICASA